ncbi:MAG: LacI family DNA-binding transcriptional regulator, partial [Rothia dentocariosa]
MAQPKLGDVAARAGVSPTTVSRVLNNRGYLSQKTRDKVFAAIRELGYRPNAIARSLQERRS